MAGLAILKHTYDLSDEVLCERWVENHYYQFFCGEEFFQHRLVFDRSSLTRWRNRMGEERLWCGRQSQVRRKPKTLKPNWTGTSWPKASKRSQTDLVPARR